MSAKQPPRRVLDLTSKPKPRPAAQPAARPPAPAGGGLPAHVDGPPLLAPGQVRRFSDAEQAVLDKLGIPLDGPMPPGLAAEIQATVQENRHLFQPQLPDGVDPDRAPLPPLNEIPLERLPPAHQAKIQAFVASYRQSLAEARELSQAQIPGAAPGVNDAIAAIRRSGGPGLEVVDDLPAPAKAHQSPPPPTPAHQAPTPGPDPEFVDKPFLAGASTFPTHCPHCNWDLKKVEDVEITDDDKVAYKAALRFQDRFRKSYDLLGGTLRVGFRALTAVESDAVMRQVAVDARLAVNGREFPEADAVFGSMMSYRLALGLDYIEWPEGKTEMPAYQEPGLAVDPPTAPDTPIRPFHDAIVKMFLPTEDLRRVVGAAQHRFEALKDRLAAKAHDPNF